MSKMQNGRNNAQVFRTAFGTAHAGGATRAPNGGASAGPSFRVGSDFVTRRAAQLGAAGPDELRAVASVLEGDGMVTGPLTAERLRGLAADLEERERERDAERWRQNGPYWKKRYDAERRYTNRLLSVLLDLIQDVEDDPDAAPIGEPSACGARIAFVFLEPGETDPDAMGVEIAMELALEVECAGDEDDNREGWQHA